MEKDYEKIDKLIKLRRDYASKVSPVEQAIEKERKNLSQEEQEVMAGEWLSRRFDAGLFSLQVCLSIPALVIHTALLTILPADRCYLGVASGGR